METSMTIQKTREDAKLILKYMPKEVQAACDKIFVAGADLGGAIVATNERDSAFRLALLDASRAYGKPKDSKYKGFGDFACAVFGFTSAPAVTNAVKVAEHIDVPKLPKLSAWYSTSMLYELRDVPTDVLKADVESGTLRAGMTSKELRAYNATHKLESDAPEVVKLYDVEITTVLYDNKGATVDIAHAYGKTLDEIKAAITGEGRPNEDDRFVSFNPHASLSRVNSKGAAKEITGKGVMYVAPGIFSKIVYFPAETSKAAKGANMTPQNYIEAARKLTPEERAAMIAALSEME